MKSLYSSTDIYENRLFFLKSDNIKIYNYIHFLKKKVNVTFCIIPKIFI